MKNKRFIAVIVVFSALLLGAIGWRFFHIFGGKGAGGKSGSSTATTRGGRSGRSGGGAPSVGVQSASRRVLQYEFDQVGSVESSQNVDIVAKSAGPILELPVRQGDAVKKGQLLVRIDPRQAQANLFKVQSDLANARYSYYQLLAQQDLTTVQAQSGVSIAAADLQAARANERKTESVFSATVTQGRTVVAQAQARLVGAQNQLRQSQLDFDAAKAKYERMLELQRQGFASNADVQDQYRLVLSSHAAVGVQRANVRVAERDVINAEAQARKDTISARADIETSRFGSVSKQASLAEAQAGTSKTAAFAQQLKAQESLVSAAEAQLRTAELQVEDTTLRSPVNGFVSDRRLDVGAMASVGAVILTVQSGQQVWVVSSFPQEVFNRIQRGMECSVTIDGVRGVTFPGVVFAKDAAIDAATRQFNIRVRIEDPKHLVKPGMFGRVKLKVGSPEPMLTIPNSALVDRDQEKRTGTVYRVVKDQIEKVAVTYDRADAQHTVITTGLKEGDTVVVQFAGTLRAEQKVKPELVTPSPTPGPLTPVTPRS